MTTNELADERSTDLEVTVCRDGKHINVRNGLSGSGEVHTVSLSESGKVEGCTCKGWTFHQTCYHVDHVRDSPLLTSSAQAASESRVATDGGSDDWTYTADCQDCIYNRTAYESTPAHAAKDRHESDCEGHNVTVRVDEGEDIHCGVF